MADITQKNKLDDSLERLTLAGSAMDPIGRELDHLQRLATMGTMAAGVAHEINNILTPAHAYAQLALGNPGNQALVIKALEKTVASIEAATSIAENILGFTAENESSNEACQIRQVIDLALETAGHRISLSRIEFDIRANHELEAHISPVALQHVILNLILNACNAMPNGGKLIVKAIETDHDRIMITVEDSGPGIDPGLLDSLFQPFASSAGSNEGGGDSGEVRSGHGLGLAVCRHLVEKAGGSIIARNSVLCGAVFVIMLNNGTKKQQIAV